MKEFSILDCESSTKDSFSLSPYYIDFNIDRIMREITLLWKEDVSSLYRYFPSNVEGQEYRKEVYKDICKEGMLEALQEFLDCMKQRKRLIDNKKLTRSGMQKMVMSLNEIRWYASALEELVSKLGNIELKSEGMLRAYQLFTEYISGEEYQRMIGRASELYNALMSIPLKLEYKDHFLNVTFEEVEGKYDSFLKDFSKEQKEPQRLKNFFQRKNPFGDSIEITALEEEILEIVYKKNTELFQNLQSFTDEYMGYAEKSILQFTDEIAFYLSYRVFELDMRDRGLFFSLAEHNSKDDLLADDLYDLALACQLSKKEQLPVANDVRLHENENFFVLTGPNQGGKTTFARSLGQLVYFSKLGLPVPARKAIVPYYTRILTHFSVEESVETGKGKLAEELSRLAPMMEDRGRNHDFVVINELFTTAANYDACIMGKRVLDHFILKDCHGIYVTHLQDLSEETKGIVSLRAMMNEEHKQNFKIVRSTDPALESSILLVEKHHLQYEVVRKRLKGEAE